MTKEVNLENTQNEIKLEKNEKNIIGSNIFPSNIYHQNLKKIEKCICRIVINSINNLYGTGFLMKLEKGNSPFYGLITCEHVISEDLIKNNTEIEIRYNYISEDKKKLTIKLNEKDRFIRVYTYLGIDAIIIEIYPEKEIQKEFFYENNLIDFLEKNNYELLQKKIIHILQFPGSEDTLSYSQGEYLEIFNINSFLHKSSTESGSSGSPIFYFYNDTIIIFGIHKAAKNVSNLIGTESKDNANIGEFIFPIIDSLRKDPYYEKSSIFTGEIIENGNGCIQKGILLFKEEKKIYVGELLKYKPNGKGIMYKYNIRNKNRIYSGDFVKGKYQGKGLLIYNYNKMIYYKGEFFENLRNGYGKYYENNKLVYEGEFNNDKYHGKGKIFYKNGGSYEGQFTNGKRDGDGIIYDKDGRAMDEGEFENDISPINGLISRLPKTTNINEINDNINQFYSIGRPLLNMFGIQTEFTCNNCGCSTNAHFYIGESIWECKRCNSTCKNNIVFNLLGL